MSSSHAATDPAQSFCPDRSGRASRDGVLPPQPFCRPHHRVGRPCFGRRSVLALGQTKLEGWHLSASAIYLFQTEYKLPLIDPWIAALLSAVNENLFSMLLIVGLASRVAGLVLLGSTLVIELFVYPDAWPTHGTWSACLLLVIARGPGKFSLDNLLSKLSAVR